MTAAYSCQKCKCADLYSRHLKSIHLNIPAFSGCIAPSICTYKMSNFATNYTLYAIVHIKYKML